MPEGVWVKAEVNEVENTLEVSWTTEDLGGQVGSGEGGFPHEHNAVVSKCRGEYWLDGELHQTIEAMDEDVEVTIPAGIPYLFCRIEDEVGGGKCEGVGVLKCIHSRVNNQHELVKHFQTLEPTRYA